MIKLKYSNLEQYPVFQRTIVKRLDQAHKGGNTSIILLNFVVFTVF